MHEPWRKFPTPCHKNRRSFLLDSPVIPWVTKRAEIWPLSDAACSFGRRHLPGFPKPEDNIHTWLQESLVFLHASHTVSKGSRRGHVLLFFPAAKPHCLTSLQNSVRLFGSWNEAYKVLNRVLASSLSITQKPWGSSHPLHKDPHTYLRAFSVIVQTRSTRENFPFFPRHSAIITEPLLIPDFHLEIAEFLCSCSARFSFEITRQETFFFFQQIYLPVIR